MSVDKQVIVDVEDRTLQRLCSIASYRNTTIDEIAAELFGAVVDGVYEALAQELTGGDGPITNIHEDGGSATLDYPPAGRP